MSSKPSTEQESETNKDGGACVDPVTLEIRNHREDSYGRDEKSQRCPLGSMLGEPEEKYKSGDDEYAASQSNQAAQCAGKQSQGDKRERESHIFCFSQLPDGAASRRERIRSESLQKLRPNSISRFVQWSVVRMGGILATAAPFVEAAMYCKVTPTWKLRLLSRK